MVRRRLCPSGLCVRTRRASVAYELSMSPTHPDQQSPEHPFDSDPRSRWSRRDFLKLGGAGAVVAALGGGIDAWCIEPQWIDVTRPVMDLTGCPPGWIGARIAQLTDIHVGRWISLDQVAEMVRLTNASQPDVVLLTGDFISPRDAITPEYSRVLSGLRANLGVFAVLGNHDHWTDPNAVRSMLSDAGVRELHNEGTPLRRNGDMVWLAGTGDLWTDPPHLERALDGAPEGVPRILMQHNPDYAEVVTPEDGVDFMVSGHTHGGQVRLPGGRAIILPVEHRRYAWGRAEGPACSVYVSRGLGVIGPGVRFNCRPELPVFELRRALAPQE